MRRALLAVPLACLAVAGPARGALRAVSGRSDPAAAEVLGGGPKEDVAYSLATGFPLWYQDASGLKLALCLDRSVASSSGVATPCLTAEPFPALPLSFPANFGAEAVWWSASAFTAFTSSRTVNGVTQNLAGAAIFVASLDAGFRDLVPIDGDQVAFGRIRVRVDVPVPGTYRVTHPYGQAIYVVPALAAEREIQQTQDVGNVAAHDAGAGTPAPPSGPPPVGDFTLALLDGPAPPAGGFDPALDAGVVSSVATGLGPFLVAADQPGGPPAAPLVALDGRVYLSDPGTDLAPRTVPVTGSPFGTDWFSIELLDPPEGFLLDAIGGTQTIRIDRFQLVGKVFDDGPNAAPIAIADAVATAKGKPVVVDVLANDADPVDPASNRHGLDPQAIGLLPDAAADVATELRLTAPLPTARGGTVRRSTDLTTGRAELVYTPAPGFAGVDTFAYVVQDTGGRVSAPATVTVLVDDLAITSAEYRPRHGKWRVRGRSTAPGASEIALLASPRAVLAGADGARGRVTFDVAPDRIALRLVLDPLPASEVTEVHLHLGAPGADGPAVFFLYDAPVDGPFTGARTATLTPARLLFVPGRPDLTFDAVAAALLAGEAYVDVHTAGLPGGALRAQVAAPRIGRATVDPATGTWSFTGRSSTSPGGSPATVTAVSSEGVHAAAVPLRYR